MIMIINDSYNYNIKLTISYIINTITSNLKMKCNYESMNHQSLS